MTETELRNAAIVHACIPTEYRNRAQSPLVDLIPDDVYPSAETWTLAEKIIGKPIPHCSGASAPYVRAARLRSQLNRWAMRQPGVTGERDDVRAREMWKAVTA